MAVAVLLDEPVSHLLREGEYLIGDVAVAIHVLVLHS